jgi:Tfp pilus assembly protein PilF
MGYNAVGNDYFTKAFQLREHASEREKLTITANYYQNVTGEQDKAAQTYQEEIESYPRDYRAHLGLGNMYAGQGQYEKAAESYRRSLRLAPDSAAPYADLGNILLSLQRFDEAQQIIHEAQARQLNNAVLHSALYALAFLSSDSAAIAEQQQWFAGKPDYENMGLALASDTEAYGGHLGKARELTKRAVDSAIRADSKESGRIWQENAAIAQAAYGNPAEARQPAAEALKMAPTSQGVEVEAALAFAMAGDTARAESMAQDSGKRYSLDTQMQSLWLPAIQAELALDKKNPAAAVTALQATIPPIELGQIAFVSNILASIRRMFMARHTWQRDRARKPPPSSRKFSATAGSSGTAGRERWRIWAWLAPMPCRREPRRARMPMPPASGRSQPTKTSSHSGKTPTLTSPS